MPPRRRAPPATEAGAEVWLTDPAVDDLQRLDGAALVWALKKMLLLERNPQAGEPLLRELIGYRKLVVGNRDWRLIWRTTRDARDRGTLLVEIAEVWAVGARSDAAVYDEMAQRVAKLQDTAVRRSLAEVVDQLGKRAKGLEPKPVAVAPSRPEPWLVDRLVYTAGLDRYTVEAMTSEAAVDAWTAYLTGFRE